MRTLIPLSEPVIQGNEWKYIKECLDTSWVSSAGSYVKKFEEVTADFLGVKHAVATVNGTAALHASLIACNVGPSDEVIVPALTFVAPVNTVRYCGAQPLFMDCDPETLCIDTEKTAEFLKGETVTKRDGFTYNKASGRKIKAMIPVHVFGHPADMDGLIRIAGDKNITIIEDATESLGSSYKNRMTGSMGRIGCLSFNGNKIITTGGGGMVLTDIKKIADEIRHLTTQARKGSLEYYHDEVGYNYRLTNIQAAMGVAQMECLDRYIKAKRRNASLYRKLFGAVENVKFFWEKPWARSNFWFYTIKVPKADKDPLIEHLISKEIQVRPVWKPIHRLPMYRGCQSYKVKYAIEAYDTCVNLPCSSNISERDIRFVAESVKRYFEG
jgi:aminotransferase in exopolysaccharide biosynthesis